MTANTSDPAALAVFEAFLEVHGANRSRWPAQQRLQFASLIATCEEARRMLVEAEALDQLIDTIGGEEAPRPTGALVDRIMASALAEVAEAKPAAVVAAAPAAPLSSSREPVAAKVIPIRPAARLSTAKWRVGAMMAASLVLGVMTGVAAMTNLGPEAAVASAETGETAYDPAVIALDSDSYGPLGGDLL